MAKVHERTVENDFLLLALRRMLVQQQRKRRRQAQQQRKRQREHQRRLPVLGSAPDWGERPRQAKGEPP